MLRNYVYSRKFFTLPDIPPCQSPHQASHLTVPSTQPCPPPCPAFPACQPVLHRHDGIANVAGRYAVLVLLQRLCVVQVKVQPPLISYTPRQTT